MVAASDFGLIETRCTVIVPEVWLRSRCSGERQIRVRDGTDPFRIPHADLARPRLHAKAEHAVRERRKAGRIHLAAPRFRRERLNGGARAGEDDLPIRAGQAVGEIAVVEIAVANRRATGNIRASASRPDGGIQGHRARRRKIRIQRLGQRQVDGSLHPQIQRQPLVRADGAVQRDVRFGRLETRAAQS